MQTNKLFYIKLLAIFLAIIWLLILSYTLKLHSLIEKNILVTIGEIAAHDRRSFNATLDFILEELGGVAKRLESGHDSNLGQMYSRLKLESTTTLFTNLYLVGANGTVYSDKFVAHAIPPKILSGLLNYQKTFTSGEKDRFVTDYTEHSEFSAISSRGVILYGIKMKNAKVAGIPMALLVGITDKNFLKDNMTIESFVSGGKGHGLSALIDNTGRYIFDSKSNIYPGQENNFFSFLSGTDSSLDKEQILEKMAKNETFHFYAETREGKNLFYFVPFSEAGHSMTDWYFILGVNNDVIGEQQSSYSLLGLSLLAIAVMLLACMMYYALRANHKLYKANEAIKVRSAFLSNMSHEIRTPLNGLIGLNYLITIHLGNESRLPQIRDWLQKSKSLADYLLSLLNDILDMSKLHSGKIEILAEPYSVEAMVDDIWFMHSANMEKKGVHFTVDKNSEWPWVIGDETRTKQILTNIIGNAAKFTPKGGTVKLSVSQKKVDSQNVKTIYRCEDSGIGMSQGFLKTIFDPFSQEKNSNADSTLKGTGLGMPICKELTEAMGGSIEVESQLGKGSVFTVTITSLLGEPVTWSDMKRPVTDMPDLDASIAAESPERGRIKILLAEDAEFNAEFLMELLEGEGFEVVHAANGKLALETFEKSTIGEYDIILMDMQMPVMNGCEASAAIRALDRPDAKTVLIYACTANTFKEDLDRAMASGMNDFLTKPINIKVFLEKLKKDKNAPFPEK